MQVSYHTHKHFQTCIKLAFTVSLFCFKALKVLDPSHLNQLLTMQYHITHDFNITLLNLHPTMSLITSLDQNLANLIPLIQPMPDCLTEYADILDLPLYSTKYLYKYHT